MLWFAGGRRCVGKPTGRKIADQPVGEWNMIGKSRALQFGGASVLAIMAVSTLMPSLAHATCLALPSTVNGIDVVNIGCQAGDPAVSPFATSYSSSSIPSLMTQRVRGYTSPQLKDRWSAHPALFMKSSM